MTFKYMYMNAMNSDISLHFLTKTWNFHDFESLDMYICKITANLINYFAKRLVI